MIPAYPAQPTCLMSHSSNKTAVIGIGHPLRKDDGIGLVIFNRLASIPDHKRFDFFDFSSSSIDLANKLSVYKTALLIDGINAGLKPGELKLFGLKEVEAQNIKDNLSSTHQIDLGQLLSLAKSLKLDTDIYVAGVQVEDISFGSGLSGRLADNIGSYVNRISEYLNSL